MRVAATPAEATLPREFEGGRLRRLRVQDCDAFQSYRAIPELGRYQGWSPMPRDEALRFLREMAQAPIFKPGEWVQLGIAEAPSDTLIGDIGLFLDEDGSTAEVGFTLSPAYQGRGIATSAVREALDVMLARTTATRVIGITDERNVASVRLLQRLRFMHVETRHTVFRGERCIENVFELMREQLP